MFAKKSHFSINFEENEKSLVSNLNNNLLRSEMTITHCFKTCVQKNLDVQAVKYENSSLTYQELDKATNQLANYIRRKFQEQFNRQLEPGTPIAISFERGLDLSICILGILKAGGAYVPIAADYPEQRIKYILKDCGAPLLLTQSSLIAKYVNLIDQIGIDTRIVDTDGESAYIKQESQDDLPIYSTPSDLAYIIYTSGSTGTPKGVLIEQSGVINLAMAEMNLFNLQKGKHVLSFSHVSFDAFVWEFFGALLSGATLCMFPQEKFLPGEPLIQTLISQKITHLTVPPSALYSTPFYYLPDLEVLVVAGEPCTKEIIDKWADKNYRFFNAYGPTEATVCATIFEVDGRHSPNTIGKPLQHVSVYILDESLNPCPIGVLGELYIGGAGVARGYLNQENLTEKSFLSNPFLTEEEYIDKQSNKLYRTGDLACFLKDGNIEFHGRKDYQVKVRGFRIELGEIQSALSRHKAIDQVIVDVYDSENQRFLVAYITLKTKEKIQGQYKLELREYLSREVPAYMIPNYYVFLDQFPLLQSGKVDRKTLGEYFLNQYQEVYDEEDFNHSDSQKRLIEIWKRVLKCGEIKVSDNFFDIGGHSLLMTQVILAIREKLGVNINIRDFLQSTTLEELARKIDELKEDKVQESFHTPSQFPKIVPDTKNYLEPFPLTDIQQAYWLGRHGDYDLSNVSTNIYREYKFINLDFLELEKALNKVVQRQDMLRCLVFNAEHQQFLKTVPFYKIKIQDLRGISRKKIDNKLKRIREEMSYRVLPSDSWPIFDVRASFLDDSILIHVCLDALVLDAWSFYLFFQEWEIFYNNPDTELPSLGLTFRDYVIAEQKIKSTTLYKEDREYWMKRIPEFPSGPDLPLAKSAHALSHQGTQCCRSYVDEASWSNLKSTAKKFKISPTGLLLSVFAEILRIWSSSSHFVINITLFNRLPIHEDVNKIIGDFTSIELLEVDHRTAGYPFYSSFLERATKLESQLYEDLQHRLFSGIELQREISRYLRTGSTGTRMPVVFTCVLDNDKNQLNSHSSNLFSFKNLNYGSTQASQVWLDFKAYEENGQLIVEWDYVYELFPVGMIPDMHNAYCQILDILDNRIDAWYQPYFDVMPHYQLEKRRVQSQSTLEGKDDSKKLLHELFLKKAKEVENKNAIISPDRTLTYKELSQLVGQLGFLIRSLSLPPNSLVGVHLEKGWEQVVACLAILKAGSAYLPLSPDWPEERIAQILKDGEVSALITRSKFKHSLSNYIEAQPLLKGKIIEIDEAKHFKSFNNIETASSQDPSHIAYVIYTSGSTGIPKGVAISHESAVNTILDINSRFAINKNDSVLALSALHFDLSVYDIFGLLAVGGTIVFPSETDLKDPEHWFYLIKKHRITVWNSVPMLMQMMVEYLEEQDYRAIENVAKTLRVVLLSGDWIPLSLPPLVEKYFKISKRNGSLVSLGGATEASIWSIFYKINQIDSSWESIPYGKALKNQEVYVLNNFLEQCPDYVAGSIYIAGKGLALCYWQDPIKTEKSFIYHPSGKRLYGTGDRGKYMGDGNIEILGRDDQQVKIKGYRVELGEIQYHLENHPSIKQAAVIPIIENKQIKNLTACVVPKDKDDGNQHDSAIVLQKVTETKEKIDITKLEFRLGQHGLRKFSNNSESINLDYSNSQNERKQFYRRTKSYRSFHHGTIEKELFEQWIVDFSNKNISDNLDVNSSFTLSALGSCLSVFAQCMMPEYPYPRYLYPSAGGLYPVQVYLCFYKSYKNIESLQPYYYDPESHSLQRVPSNIKFNTVMKDEKSLFSLYFIGKRSAIFPIYGEMSKDFCNLEAGYMQAIFYPALASVNWKASSDVHFTEKVDLQTALELDRDDIIINRLIVEKSKAVKKIKGITEGYGDKTVSIYFYIKSNTVLGLTQGLYELKPQTKKLLLISKTFVVSEEDYIGENKLLFRDASFCVFFLARGRELSKSSNQGDASLIRAGELSQTLKTAALAYNIGLCPIGIMGLEFEKRLQKVFGGRKLLHSLIGGSITLSQMESPLSSQPRQSQPFDVGSLRQYLSSKIPEHMIPSSIFSLKQLPLTGNGKIDRQALLEYMKIPEQKNGKVSQEPKTEIEKILVQIWKEVLKIKTIGVNMNFFEIGGDSLLMARIILKIRKTFGVNVALRQMLMNPTIEDFSRFLEGKFQISSELEDSPKNDANLFKKLVPFIESAPKPHSRTPSSFLITGVSGFLGIHLLSDLYKRIQGQVYCLIRANSDQEARVVLEKTFKKYNLTDLSKDSRLIPVIGDLSKPFLGLETNQFNYLAQTIDTIYHVGAFVHHIYDYKKLRSANVLGTIELLKLAMFKKVKPFHYVSSIVAALEKDEKGMIREDFPQSEDCGDIDGYTQSKWVCEKILSQANKYGALVNVYRPCTITGRSKDGVSSPFKDHLMNVIKGCIQMGFAPDWPLELDIIPVDFVSSLIVHASLSLKTHGKVFNITNRHTLPWRELIKWLCNYGYKIQIVPDSIWRANLLKIDSDNALFPLLPLYLDNSGLYSELLSEPAISSYQDHCAYKIFKATKALPPKIDSNVLSIYFNYLHKCGFLKEPPIANYSPKALVGGMQQ